MLKIIFKNFLGNSPTWYKLLIIIFLVINPLLALISINLVSWLIICEVIFCLIMALKCYPLQPSGLIALEAVIMHLTSPNQIYKEIQINLPVILLLIFMVSAIHFMRPTLLHYFSKLVLNIKTKYVQSLSFIIVSAFLSAFLDALTVMAVIISVATGFYNVYHNKISSLSDDEKKLAGHNKHELTEFREYLCNLVMHAAIGTVLGGVLTVVGEPQNLLIAQHVGWNFIDYVYHIFPLVIPIVLGALLLCYLLETYQLFGYGKKIPIAALKILQNFEIEKNTDHPLQYKCTLYTQTILAIILIILLTLQVAEVGLIGIGLLILLTSLGGITEEHQIGKSFIESLPFTALLIVFFTIIAIINDQNLFKPIIDWLLSLPHHIQPIIFFLVNGILSSISDNVFVASIYIETVKKAFDQGLISMAHLNQLAIAINIGTNIPSIATPNGQAAFLFLLTSALAPLIRLSYGKMIWMALPYTVVLTGIGFVNLCLFS